MPSKSDLLAAFFGENHAAFINGFPFAVSGCGLLAKRLTAFLRPPLIVV
jgi:hypothetical protein